MKGSLSVVNWAIQNIVNGGQLRSFFNEVQINEVILKVSLMFDEMFLGFIKVDVCLSIFTNSMLLNQPSDLLVTVYLS